MCESKTGQFSSELTLPYCRPALTFIVARQTPCTVVADEAFAADVDYGPEVTGTGTACGDIPLADSLNDRLVGAQEKGFRDREVDHLGARRPIVLASTL
jgi:hypothetical protein